MITTISISKEIKELLERKKREMELRLGRALSWDEYFRILIKEENPQPPKLSKEDAERLKELLVERKWRERYA